MDTTKPQCHHIMDSGRRCETPPLKGKPFCYYHRRLHADFILPGHPEYMPPVLDSRHSIQIAVNDIFLALSKNLLDRRLATTMLYAIQLAQTNLGKQGLQPSYKSVEEITPPMQQALHLDDNLEDPNIRDASEHTPRSTDTAPRCAPVRIGANDAEALIPDNDPEKAIECSNRLATKEFSRSRMPEFVPELDPEEWLRVTRDLPPKGQPGTAQQQMNCRRVLQILSFDGMRRRMAGPQ